MQRTADCHEQIAEARLPQTAGVVHDAAARDAAVDVLEAHATAREAPMRRFLRAREGPASRLPRRPHDVDPVERTRQAAAILESSATCRQGVGGGIRNPLIVGAAGLGLTEKADREGRMDQQPVVDRVARFLAAITARLLSWLLGALEAPLGPVGPTRGQAGAEAGAAAGGPDVLGGSSVGTTSALTSASVTPRRFASAVKDRVGASPCTRRVARRTTQSTCIP
jgi:hypothetical protein